MSKMTLYFEMVIFMLRGVEPLGRVRRPGYLFPSHSGTCPFHLHHCLRLLRFLLLSQAPMHTALSLTRHGSQEGRHSAQFFSLWEGSRLLLLALLGAMACERKRIMRGGLQKEEEAKKTEAMMEVKGTGAAVARE